jgi:hypothetical protein
MQSMQCYSSHIISQQHQVLCLCIAYYSFWFHGDDEPLERLRLLDAYLSEYEQKEVGVGK